MELQSQFMQFIDEAKILPTPIALKVHHPTFIAFFCNGRCSFIDLSRCDNFGLSGLVSKDVN